MLALIAATLGYRTGHKMPDHSTDYAFAPGTPNAAMPIFVSGEPAGSGTPSHYQRCAHDGQCRQIQPAARVRFITPQVPIYDTARPRRADLRALTTWRAYLGLASQPLRRQHIFERAAVSERKRHAILESKCWSILGRRACTRCHIRHASSFLSSYFYWRQYFDAMPLAFISIRDDKTTCQLLDYEPFTTLSRQ